jgi:hypothetical protein
MSREARHLRLVEQKLEQQRADREPDQDLARLRVEHATLLDDLTWIKQQRRLETEWPQVERRQHGTRRQHGDRRQHHWWKW